MTIEETYNLISSSKKYLIKGNYRDMCPQVYTDAYKSFFPSTFFEAFNKTLIIIKMLNFFEINKAEKSQVESCISFKRSRIARIKCLQIYNYSLTTDLIIKR